MNACMLPLSAGSVGKSGKYILTNFVLCLNMLLQLNITVFVCFCSLIFNLACLKGTSLYIGIFQGHYCLTFCMNFLFTTLKILRHSQRNDFDANPEIICLILACNVMH